MAEANKRSDFAIRDQKNRVVEQTKRVLKRWEKFDRFDYVLSKSLPFLFKQLEKYRGDLEFIMKFFTGPQYDKVAKQTMDMFFDKLKQFPETSNLKKTRGETDRVMNSIKREFGGQISDLLDGIVSNQKIKFNRYQLMAKTEVIPKARLKELLQQKIDIVQIKGKVYTNESLGNLWGLMTKNYGSYGELQFNVNNPLRKTTRIPLNTYVNGKAITMANDIQNLGTIIQSSRKGVMVNRISRHGATDSCNIWEGKFVFISDRAKVEFLTKYPEIKAARKWPTYEQVRSDASHIFKFNCRHILTPAPVQFFPDKEIEDLQSGPKPQKSAKEAKKNMEKVNKERVA